MQAWARNPDRGGLLTTHILKKFGVWYGRGGAPKLAHRLNFSVRRDRPVHHKTVTAEEERRYVGRRRSRTIGHTRAGFGAVCTDASALENGSSHARGLRAVGGTETVGVNFSKKTVKMTGAVGANSCHLTSAKGPAPTTSSCCLRASGGTTAECSSCWTTPQRGSVSNSVDGFRARSSPKAAASAEDALHFYTPAA